MKTLTAEKNSASPQTNTICIAHTNGSQSNWRLTLTPEIRSTENKRPICTSRCTQLESTLVMGTISRGTGTRLIRPSLSTMQVEPVIHDTVKKLNGTIPQSTNDRLAKLGKKLGQALLGGVGCASFWRPNCPNRKSVV